MRELGEELKLEIKTMSENGHSVSEIHEATKVSKGTIRKYQTEFGLRDDHGQGGVVSKSILIPNVDPVNPDGTKKDKKDEPKSVVISDQVLKIIGTESMTAFRAELNKDTITIEGESIMGEIKIDQLLNIANELTDVYKLVMRMKSNRWDLI